MRYTRAESPFSLTPWVRGLLIANAVVYLLTITVFTGDWFGQTFAFAPFAAGRHWWTFITYMFVHAGFLHLAFNMLMLFFFGPAVEERMGGTGFALYYLVCGLGGAIFSYVIALFSPIGSVLGASAAIFGVALAFAMRWPNAEIYVFPLPVPIKAKWLVMFLAAGDLLAQIMSTAFGVQDGIAHFAHLGGFVFGFIYLKSEEAVIRRARTAVKRRTPQLVSQAAARSPREARRARAAEEAPEPRHTRRDEVDRVLDKISERGLDSLTPDERRLLDDMSRELREH